MKKKPAEKALKKSISFLPSHLKKVEGKVEHRFGGNLSKYMQSLVEADIAGGSVPRADNLDCLVTLAEGFAPTYVEEMRKQCEGVDQAKALELLLKLVALGKLDISREFMMAAEEMASYGKKKS